MVRVRFAPSPTGFMHLGGLRTALFNAVFARKHGGQMILRIEDTDQARLVPGAAAALEEVLQWCGIVPDESPSVGGPCGPYVQSERLHLYREHAAGLVDNGAAYRCFCSPDRLNLLRRRASKTDHVTSYDGACRDLAPDDVRARLEGGAAHTVRLRVPREGKMVVQDEVYGAVAFSNDGIDDQVLLKSNGYPTYHLANVVDDHLMQVSHVLRGEEWLSSSAQHLHLYNAFGWDAPRFGHIPLLVNTDRSKLSKRQGDLNISELRAKGVLPEALVNFVAFLGWSSPGLQSETFSGVDDIAASFSLAAVSRSPAAVDLRKLQYLNKQHQTVLTAESQSLETVVEALFPQLEAAYSDDAVPPDTLTREYLRRVLLGSAGTFDMMAEVLDCSYFWRDPTWTSPESMAAGAKHAAAGKMVFIPALQRNIEAVAPTEFYADALKAALKLAAADAGCKVGALQPLLRYCLTGSNNPGPPVLRVMELVGKERSLARLAGAAAAQSDVG